MTSETETKPERNIVTTETETKLPARLEDVADVMLAATASSNPLLRFVKGEYFIGEGEIEVGHEYIAYPFDAMIGFARWEDDVVVEQIVKQTVTVEPNIREEILEVLF